MIRIIITIIVIMGEPEFDIVPTTIQPMPSRSTKSFSSSPCWKRGNVQPITVLLTSPEGNSCLLVLGREYGNKFYDL